MLVRRAFFINWNKLVIEPSNLRLNNMLLHHARLRPQPQNELFRAFRSSVRPSSKRALTNTLQATPFEPLAASGPVPPGNVLKAIIFAGTFSVSCFAGATIMEYENTRNMMMKRARQTTFSWLRRKQQEEKTRWTEIKREIELYWDKLTPGEKVFVPICALNVLVFGLWRIPSLRPTMMKYFTSNPAARAVCWPMFLSTFSHYSLFHICANMYVLHSFSNAAVAALGKEQFTAVYLSAGVVASLASIVYKAVTSQAGLSIGASGAIMGILAFVCTQYPNTELSVLFLPMFTFSAGAAIKVIMGIDLAGCILGWKFFDHAAHLGGALFGIFWAYYGHELWSKRLPLLTMYHDWRRTK